MPEEGQNVGPHFCSVVECYCDCAPAVTRHETSRRALSKILMMMGPRITPTVGDSKSRACLFSFSRQPNRVYAPVTSSVIDRRLQTLGNVLTSFFSIRAKCIEYY